MERPTAAPVPGATASPTILIVGGVAGGASAAARARRMNEQARIVIFERDAYVSFANCGLPYYLGGEIKDREQAAHRQAGACSSEALPDRGAHAPGGPVHRPRARSRHGQGPRAAGRTYEERYDKLILAPGASPFVPPVPGIDATGCSRCATSRTPTVSPRRCPAPSVRSSWVAATSAWRPRSSSADAGWRSRSWRCCRR